MTVLAEYKFLYSAKTHFFIVHLAKYKLFSNGDYYWKKG